MPGKSPRWERDAHEHHDHEVDRLYPQASSEWKPGSASLAAQYPPRPLSTTPIVFQMIARSMKKLAFLS